MGIHGGGDHAELGEEAGRERHPGLGQEQHGEAEGQGRAAPGQAGEVVDRGLGVPLPGHDRDDPEGPGGDGGVGGQVEECSGRAVGGGGLHAEEDEAGVVDGRVRHHPLHVRLHRGEHGAHHQAGHGQGVDHRLPVHVPLVEGGDEDPEQRAEGRDLDRAGHVRDRR